MPYESCPNENPDCKYFPGCFADRHHEYWPRADYRTALEKRFRAHFVELLCRRLHDEQHTLPPPDKPAPSEMREALND